MAFPQEMNTTDRRRLALFGFLFIAAVAAVAAIFAVVVVKGGGGTASAETVREYNLEIVATDIDYGNGNVWHAWTYRNADDPDDTGHGSRARRCRRMSAKSWSFTSRTSWTSFTASIPTWRTTAWRTTAAS